MATQKHWHPNFWAGGSAATSNFWHPNFWPGAGGSDAPVVESSLVRRYSSARRYRLPSWLIPWVIPWLC